MQCFCGNNEWTKHEYLIDGGDCPPDSTGRYYFACKCGVQVPEDIVDGKQLHLFNQLSFWDARNIVIGIGTYNYRDRPKWHYELWRLWRDKKYFEAMKIYNQNIKQ